MAPDNGWPAKPGAGEEITLSAWLYSALSRAAVGGPWWQRWWAAAADAVEAGWRRALATIAHEGLQRWRSGLTLVGAGVVALGLSTSGVISAMNESWTPAQASTGLQFGAQTGQRQQEEPPNEPVATTQPEDSRAGAAADAMRPNIIVIYLDDMRVSDLEVMHNVNRKIADNGVTFTNSAVSTALCCPSRATFLTGQYAHNTGVLHNSPPNGGYEKFRSGKQAAGETLPIWLRDAGYRTVLFGKFMNHYPGTEDTFDVPTGFTDWYGLFEGPFEGVQRSVYRQTSYAVRVKADEPVLDQRRAHQVIDVDDGDGGQVWIYRGEANHQTEVLMDGAVRAIEEHDGSRPLYLTVSLTAPHSGGDAPVIGGGDYETKARPVTTRPAQPELERLQSLLARGSDLGELGLERPESFNERKIADKPESFRQQPRLTSEDIEDLEIRNALRLASLQSVDRRIPDLLAAIKAADQRTGRQSYVVFTSDNGYFLGEHRMATEKNWHYGAATDVPLVVSGPGVARDAQVGVAVANVDLAPTIVGMAGDIDSDGKIDGRSLLPLLERPNRFEASARWRNRAVLLQGRWGGSSKLRYAGVRTASHVYVEHYAPGDGVTVEFVELYDRGRDPDYTHNLLHGRVSSEAGAIANKLAAVLTQLKACSGEECRDHQLAQPAVSSDGAPKAGQGSRRKRKNDAPAPATIGPPLEFGSSERPSSDSGREPSPPGNESPPAPAPDPPSPPPRDTLYTGQKLGPNGRLESRNGKYTLVMQEDGNLVVYRNGFLPDVWSSGTHGHDGENAYLVVQNDGNVVIYNRERALWSTRTHGRTNTKLIMQDDGVLGAWADEGPVWRSH